MKLFHLFQILTDHKEASTMLKLLLVELRMIQEVVNKRHENSAEKRKQRDELGRKAQKTSQNTTPSRSTPRAQRKEKGSVWKAQNFRRSWKQRNANDGNLHKAPLWIPSKKLGSTWYFSCYPSHQRWAESCLIGWIAETGPECRQGCEEMHWLIAWQLVSPPAMKQQKHGYSNSLFSPKIKQA